MMPFPGGTGNPCSSQAAVQGLLVVVIVVPVVVMVLVPAMVMGDLAVAAVPVTVEVARSIMMRLDPVSAFIRRTGPVSIVPFIVAALRVPIASNPVIAGAGAPRLHPDDARRGWRSDSYSDGKLGEDRSCC